MKSQARISISLVALVAVSCMSTAFAQTDEEDANEELKIAAVEALMSAPPERALPIVEKVLAGDHSDDVKERALFILSQIDRPEAQKILLETARTSSGGLQEEAIRMVGIGGDVDALAELKEVYRVGDVGVKESVLEAYMIADDVNAVYEVAVIATDAEEFEHAVEILGAMGATEELRKLRETVGNSGILVEAYAIAGDYESLRTMALDPSNPEIQEEAIQGLGIVGGPDVNATLLEIYRGTDSEDIREAALEGMLIADYDEGVVVLFRESQDAEEKRDLLEMLVIMDSDAAMEIIDETLGGTR
ncbi:MAG: HEAT repeat protein [Woeseiaceae bacterium]|jgi:HEAT repeat protein